MTKAEIIDAVYEKVGGLSKKEAVEIVEAVFDTMNEVLAEGAKIKISGFGNFIVRYKKQRVGRNPQTGHPIPSSARRVLTFKPSQVLKGILNPHKDLRKDGEGDVTGGGLSPSSSGSLAGKAGVFAQGAGGLSSHSGGASVGGASVGGASVGGASSGPAAPSAGSPSRGHGDSASDGSKPSGSEGGTPSFS